ncbi:MAG: streptomycin 6-kinase [Yoonia sp.]|jgi:streptomycin 6-kinase
MKFEIKSPENAVRTIAARWNLAVQGCLAETDPSAVHKGVGPQGQIIRKLYKSLGSNGEDAAVPFLRGLAPKCGIKIHRVSTFRTAVLFGYLEGPTLVSLLKNGNEAQATAHLAQVASAVSGKVFKFPFLYRRNTPKYQNDFKRSLAEQATQGPDNDLQRAAATLDHIVKSTTQECVLHGDLHYGYVILTTDGPPLIDPKGFVADPSFEFHKTLASSFKNVSVAEFAACIARRAPVMADAIGASSVQVIKWGAVTFALRVFSGSLRNKDKHQIRPYLQAFLDLAES